MTVNIHPASTPRRRQGAVLHLARFDVRRWGGLFAAAAIAEPSVRILAETAPVAALHRPALGPLLDVATLAAALLRVLLALVLIAVVCHETPLVDRRAFWLTRPLTTGQIVAAKLLTLGITLIAWPVALEALLLLRRGAPGGLVALDSAEALVGWRFAALLVAVLAASLTRSTASYLMLLAASGVVFIGVVVTIAALSPPAWAYPAWSWSAPPPIPDSWFVVQAWAGTIITCLAPLLVLVVTRDRRRAVVVLGLLLALTPIPQWPPIPPTPRATIATPAWASDPAHLALSIDPAEAVLGSLGPGGGLLPPDAFTRRMPQPLHAQLAHRPEPAGYFAEVASFQSRFTAADGVGVGGDGRMRYRILPTGAVRRPSSHLDAWQVALGQDVRFKLPAGATTRWRTPGIVLGTIDRESDAERLTAAPARYDGWVTFDLWNHRLVATRPAAARVVGTRLEDEGDVFEVLAFARQPRSVALLVRQTSLSPITGPRLAPMWHVALQAPGGVEILPATRLATRGTMEGALARFSLARWRVSWPGDDQPREQVTALECSLEAYTDVDEAWLDRARIAIIRTRYAGRVTRRLHLDALTVRRAAPLPQAAR